ncbi:MAG: hypothetical protein IPH57_05100 [Saprospiraceae bacterium]|nr:hypothetical protein [Saprospiraceae bacterium]
MNKIDEFDLTLNDDKGQSVEVDNKDEVLLGNIDQPKEKTSSEEESLEFPNSIEVVIADPSPVIILFGARTSGKTMTLIRLTRYLRKHGYQVEPDRIFRPSKSKHYQKMCDEFNKNVNSNDISENGTPVINFMLVKVMNRFGEPVCQILEAPGEHYFDESKPNMPFPRYINEILNIDNQKTWVFIVEKGWKDVEVRNNYANKIIEMEHLINTKDRIIFTCHKADLHTALMSQGNPNIKQFFVDIKNQYEGIFDKYINKTPILNWFKKYNFNFVVFSAGKFNKLEEGRTGFTYNQGNDKYPTALWNAILKTINGSWF